MNPLGLAPLAVAVGIVALVYLAPLSRRLDTVMTRASRRLFGRYVTEDAPERRHRLRAAFVDQTYRGYAARTYLVTALSALAGVIAGVYLTGGVLVALPAIETFAESLPSVMGRVAGALVVAPTLTPVQFLVVVTAGGLVVGLVVAALTYWYRWESLRSTAEVRRRGINEGLPRTVAFVYALSRGGVAVPKVMRTLADNRDVYGHGADEISVAVREMDLFGRDIITAVRHVAERTPSEQFKTFSENLASVLQGGQNLSSFLRDQYERYREEAEDRQEEILELLATIAEAYVTTLVAGTLFLMTVLLVFGLTTTSTFTFLQLLAYVMIPLANLLFVVYLSGKLELLGVARGNEVGALRDAIRDNHTRPGAQRFGGAGSGTKSSTRKASGSAGLPGDGSQSDTGSPGDLTPSADGGQAEGDRADAGQVARPPVPDRPAGAVGGPDLARESSPGTARSDDGIARQLQTYAAVSRVKRVLGNPFATLLRRPTNVLYVTVPVAVLSILLRAPSAFTGGTFRIRVFDDILVQAVLFVVATFAVVWEVYTRRIRRMEAQLPEFLERLASLNDAGMSLTESIRRVRESDLGPLTPEVDRIYRDIEFGSNVDDALRRFGLRVRTTATTRVVTLVTNALRASGQLTPVLRIAGEQAESELRLRRKRRQQMLTYLVVIYISFLVFLVIIVAVEQVLVPSLPTDVPTPENTDRLAVNADQFTRFGEVNKAAYTLVFFHTALIQALLSGFIGGQIGEGSLKDGAKHAAIMLGVAYAAFLLLSSPVAQVSFSEQTVDDGAVVVDSVSMSKGGYVTIRAETADGAVIGHSGYLRPGTHEDVEIQLDNPPTGTRTLYAVPHFDTNGNERFDFTVGSSTDTPYPSEGGPGGDSAEVSN